MIAVYQIFVQSLALLALGLFALSFHTKTRERILLGQLASLTVWALHFALLSAWTGAVLCVVNAVITCVFLLQRNGGLGRERRKGLLYTSLAALIAAVIATWEGFYSIFAFLGVASITLSKWQIELRNIRVIAIAASVFWIIYDIFVGSYGGIFSELIIILSILMSLRKD